MKTSWISYKDVLLLKLWSKALPSSMGTQSLQKKTEIHKGYKHRLNRATADPTATDQIVDSTHFSWHACYTKKRHGTQNQHHHLPCPYIPSSQIYKTRLDTIAPA